MGVKKVVKTQNCSFALATLLSAQPILSHPSAAAVAVDAAAGDDVCKEALPRAAARRTSGAATRHIGGVGWGGACVFVRARRRVRCVAQRRMRKEKLGARSDGSPRTCELHLFAMFALPARRAAALAACREWGVSHALLDTSFGRSISSTAARHGGASFDYAPPDPVVLPRIVRKNGVDLIHDPLFNKVRNEGLCCGGGRMKDWEPC